MGKVPNLPKRSTGHFGLGPLPIYGCSSHEFHVDSKPRRTKGPWKESAKLLPGHVGVWCGWLFGLIFYNMVDINRAYIGVCLVIP